MSKVPIWAREPHSRILARRCSSQVAWVCSHPTESTPSLAMSALTLGIATVVWVGKMPERFLPPGTLDLFGNSHNIMHVLVCAPTAKSTRRTSRCPLFCSSSQKVLHVSRVHPRSTHVFCSFTLLVLLLLVHSACPSSQHRSSLSSCNCSGTTVTNCSQGRRRLTANHRCSPQARGMTRHRMTNWPGVRVGLVLIISSRM